MQGIQRRQQQIVVSQSTTLLTLDKAHHAQRKVGQARHGQHCRPGREPQRRSRQRLRQQPAKVFRHHQQAYAKQTHSGGKQRAPEVAQHRADDDMKAKEHTDRVANPAAGQKQQRQCSYVGQGLQL